MSAPCRKGYCYEARHRRARRAYLCDWCGKTILAGAEYVIVTEFPGGEAGYADAAGHPVRIRIHAEQPCHYHEAVA